VNLLVHINHACISCPAQHAVPAVTQEPISFCYTRINLKTFCYTRIGPTRTNLERQCTHTHHRSRTSSMHQTTDLLQAVHAAHHRSDTCSMQHTTDLKVALYAAHKKCAACAERLSLASVRETSIGCETRRNTQHPTRVTLSVGQETCHVSQITCHDVHTLCDIAHAHSYTCQSNAAAAAADNTANTATLPYRDSTTHSDTYCSLHYLGSAHFLFNAHVDAPEAYENTGVALPIDRPALVHAT
jgi:hypothetical protein